MARSSGGGSRGGGGGSRSSGGSRSGGSRGGSGRSYRTSSSYFPGARKFRYYRGGTAHYVYSDRDLRKCPDVKPRWFLFLFYIPFFCAMLGVWSGALNFPEKPLTTYNSSLVQVIDNNDVFSDKEEHELLSLLKDFGETTGVTTKIITIPYDEWTDNGSLDTYTYYRYYAEFTDENGWLICYSEVDNGAGDWSWEGVQGDNTIDAMDVFLEDFNTTMQSQLMIDQIPDVSKAFTRSFEKAIDAFQNQKFHIEVEELGMAVFITLFICFHCGIMVFAGCNFKYKNKNLEEVTASTTQSSQYSTQQSNNDEWIECNYCGYKWEDPQNNRCPHCGAIVNTNIR